MKRTPKTLVLIVEDGSLGYFENILLGDYTICSYQDEGSTSGDIMRTVTVNGKPCKILKVTEVHDDLVHHIQDNRSKIASYKGACKSYEEKNDPRDAWIIHSLEYKIDELEKTTDFYLKAKESLKKRALGFALVDKTFSQEVNRL